MKVDRAPGKERPPEFERFQNLKEFVMHNGNQTPEGAFVVDRISDGHLAPVSYIAFWPPTSTAGEELQMVNTSVTNWERKDDFIAIETWRYAIDVVRGDYLVPSSSVETDTSHVMAPEHNLGEPFKVFDIPDHSKQRAVATFLNQMEVLISPDDAETLDQ